MGKIIYCSDLILRVDDHQEIGNVTEFFQTNTDFHPLRPEDCVIRSEMSSMGKLSVIMLVWGALIVLTTIYCYFCEQRLFPQQKLADKFPTSCIGCQRASSTTSSSPLSTPTHSIPSSPTVPVMQNLSSTLSNDNFDMFKSPSITSQSSLLSSNASGHTTQVMKECNNPRYRQSNTNAYRRICQPSSTSPIFSQRSPGVYDYSSLPSSPTTLTSVDTFPTFNVQRASTNSEELINIGTTEKLGKLNKSDLPFQVGRNQNAMVFGTANNSINGLGYKLEAPIEENLIQLDDSPKHRLRARKPNNMKNDTKNNFDKNDYRFENEQKFSMPTYSIPKSFL